MLLLLEVLQLVYHLFLFLHLTELVEKHFHLKKILKNYFQKYLNLYSLWNYLSESDRLSRVYHLMGTPEKTDLLNYPLMYLMIPFPSFGCFHYHLAFQSHYLRMYCCHQNLFLNLYLGWYLLIHQTLH